MRSENPLNFGDVSKRMFNGGICEFESYNPSQAVRSLGCPVRVSLRNIPAAYGDGGGSLWRIFLVSRRRWRN